MTRIITPQLDVNIMDATVMRWHKAVNEMVAVGEPLVELNTDKALFEIEAPASGTLLAVFAPEKSVVPTGYILGLIGAPGEVDSEANAWNERCITAYRGGSSDVVTPVTPPSARVRATPRARRLARDNNLDLAEIQAKTGVDVIDESVITEFLKRG